MKSTKAKIAIVVAVVVLVAAMLLAYFLLKPGTTEGAKSITIEVVNPNGDGSATPYRLNTDAEYLEQAMNEADGLTWSGYEGPYGMTVDTVNGVRADYTLDGAYWAFYVNGEYCNYGISEQPVNDGDVFSIVYTEA